MTDEERRDEMLEVLDESTHSIEMAFATHETYLDEGQQAMIVQAVKILEQVTTELREGI